MLLLQKKSINPCIIDILEHWFSISSAQIKWNNILSDPVTLLAGVRQGGILSPLLFTAYIDIVLRELELSKLGCYINSKCMNSFLYADDLILLAISVTDLQLLVSKCLVVFNSLDLHINCAKSVCLRIGPRFSASCKTIMAANSTLKWVSEVKYLGIHLKSSANVTFNWQPARSNFYKALNNIMGALGPNPPINVPLSLIRAVFSYPYLWY